MTRTHGTIVSYTSWRKALDQILERTYAITIEDAGLEDQQLVSYWNGKESPEEFARWFGAKYDLQPNDRPIIC
jgi:hypothetical protein